MAMGESSNVERPRITPRSEGPSSGPSDPLLRFRTKLCKVRGMGSTRRKATRNTTTAVVYCRVSATDSQSESDNSLESQERLLTALAQAAGYSEIVVVRERHTASKTQPMLEETLKALDAGTYAALFVWKVDRITRKGAADVLRIADKADKHGWRLVISDVSMDTGTTVGRLVLTILAGVAEMESRRRSERMREYHAEKRAQGHVAGITYGLRSEVPAQQQQRIIERRAAGATYAAIAAEMTETTGRRWNITQVRRVVVNVKRSRAGRMIVA